MQNALIAVVKEQDVKRTCSGGADDVGIMLGTKPVHRIHGVESSILQSKITLVAKLPKDGAVGRPIVVVDLDDPIKTSPVTVVPDTSRSVEARKTMCPLGITAKS